MDALVGLVGFAKGFPGDSPGFLPHLHKEHLTTTMTTICIEIIAPNAKRLSKQTTPYQLAAQCSIGGSKAMEAPLEIIILPNMWLLLRSSPFLGSNMWVLLLFPAVSCMLVSSSTLSVLWGLVLLPLRVSKISSSYCLFPQNPAFQFESESRSHSACVCRRC